MKRGLVVLVALLMLAACSSSMLRVEDRHYSLVLAGDTGAGVDATKLAGADLVIGPIQLPTYLRGRTISMQVGANRIESAHHHFWAEPLDEAIAKVLVRDVAADTGDIIVDRESGRWTASAACRVRVEFDALHPTQDARTVTRGRFWLVSAAGESRREFDLPQTLERDGYAHAVDQLRASLAKLAKAIAAEVSALNQCGKTRADPIGSDALGAG